MIYIFEIDGRLTRSRNKMDEKFQSFFKTFSLNKKSLLLNYMPDGPFKNLK